jgi:hypothetical protein
VSVNAPADAGDLATDLKSAFVTNMIPRLPSPLHLVNTEVQYQEAALPASPVIGSDATVADGSNGENALVPQNTAWLVHKRTGSGGRSGRGRMYFPGVWESGVSSTGVVSSSVLSTYNPSLTAWLTAIAAIVEVGSMHLLHDSTGAAALDAPTPVTSLNLDPMVATQRRRLRH